MNVQHVVKFDSEQAQKEECKKNYDHFKKAVQDCKTKECIEKVSNSISRFYNAGLLSERQLGYLDQLLFVQQADILRIDEKMVF